MSLSSTNSSSKSWAENLTLATTSAAGTGALIDNAVNALQISLGLSMSKSKGDASSTTYNNSQLTANSGTIKINSLNNATFSGANLLAENIELNTQGDLTVESLQNSYKEKGSSFGMNLGGGGGAGSQSGSGNASLGLNYSSNKTDRLWVDNQTSILGTNSVTINTKDNSNLKGAVIANITNIPDSVILAQAGIQEFLNSGSAIDGNNLTLNSNSLTFSNLYDHEYSQSSGFGISTNIGRGSNNTNGQGSAPASNPNQQTNYYPNGSTTLSAQNSGYKKEQTTFATLGSGDITTGSTLTFDSNGNVITNSGGALLASTDALLTGLNRDIANSQVMTKDTITNALNVTTTIDNRLFTEAGRGEMEKEQKNILGNVIISNTTLITGTKDIITSAFETNPNDPKNDTYFEVLNNKTNLRTNSILNTKSLLQSAENAKYYNNKSDDKSGFYDPKTGETFINLAYNQSTGSLMETTLHETAHQQNNLPQNIEETLAQNYSKQASDLINFYHNRDVYSDSSASSLVSWGYQNSSLSGQYNASEDYLNNFYNNSTTSITPASIAVNNILVRNANKDEIEPALMAAIFGKSEEEKFNKNLKETKEETLNKLADEYTATNNPLKKAALATTLGVGSVLIPESANEIELGIATGGVSKAYAPQIGAALNKIDDGFNSLLGKFFGRTPESTTSLSTGILKPDFYSGENGVTISATGYRAIGGPAVTRAIGGDGMSERGITYFTFDDVSRMSPGQAQSVLQLDQTPSHYIKFDTLHQFDSIQIPTTHWNEGVNLEPFTSSYPEFGIGGATQVITTKPIENFTLNPLSGAKK